MADNNTSNALPLLSSLAMAAFVSRGFFRMEEVVPAALNQAFLQSIGHRGDSSAQSVQQHYERVMSNSSIPLVNAGTPLADAYDVDSTLAQIVAVPAVAGAIASLVGPAPVFDHHFLHMTFPASFYSASKRPQASQHTHQDSTIDPRMAFDMQLLYFPTDVTLAMGGTRFVPGTHLRVVSEAAIARYQNIRGQQHMVCKAGTVLLLHSGIWHGGGLNRSDTIRYMFKIRMAPSSRQTRRWDDSDISAAHFQQGPIFWTGANAERDPIHEILTAAEPWFEADTGRLEYLNRIRLWRYLLGDNNFDADYWLTRIENEYR
ncbi:MAG: hypothetical protein ACI9WS_001297 [Paraglaciecola psychrophila]|jgi:hypothetical protein